jgi:putative inorganic carbon (HCO3(-)) transporter
MPLRDLTITVLVFGLLPVVLRRPYVGVLIWSWLSYMNPHRLTWGFAYDFPFAQTVALTLFASMLITKEKLALPKKPIIVIWILFLIWMTITTFAALYPGDAMQKYMLIIKIQVFAFITILLINTRDRIDQLIWVIVVSIGYYSIKGGLFTIATEGSFRVWGPPQSFIGGNNELALATLMILPLMEYLRQVSRNAWLKRGLLVGMGLSMVSAVGSQSRGAFLAILAVAFFFWLKSSRKAAWAVAFVLLLPGIFLLMPASWHERMSSIKEYEEDPSAMGRLNAWGYAINVANDRITGGGLESWQHGAFAIYAPDRTIKTLVAHSIYFSVLGDHGWIGFILWFAIYLSTWRSASWVIKHGRGLEDFEWAVILARMMQVGLVAYATGGAFLSLSYFDLPWHYVAIILVMRVILEKRFEEEGRARDQSRETGLFARMVR